MKVSLPAVFRIDAKERRNTVRQLAEPPWTGDAELEPVPGRTRAFTIRRGDDLPPVSLLIGSSALNPDWSLAVRSRLAVDPTSASLDLSDAKWVKHPAQENVFTDLADFEANAASTRESWVGAFTYKREDPTAQVDGLRPPQLGSVWAVQAHWTASADAATVVLPTGVGKTETMLSLLIAERLERLLVVVPTDALRSQLADKFLSLGLLKTLRFGVVAPGARYPVVGILNRRPPNSADVDSFFLKCNVVVTTMPLASQCDAAVIQRMAGHVSCLFIDEAHHVAAPTWKRFREFFGDKRIAQFTATPFRSDDQPMGGQRAYTFTLRQAQSQGYFKQIQFKPVLEFDPAQKDAAIAEAAVSQLKADAPLRHVVLARVGSIPRAAAVLECYRKYAEFNPVAIHTALSSKVREDIRRMILTGQSRIVVCVDMLGEGFDMPELKIAAFHDIRKSLAVTLQLVGRFTRTRPDLGNATVVANIADLEVKDELKKLYQHDSDWNVLLPLLNERVTQDDFSLWEFLGGFKELPEQLTLRNVRPATSTVVYRTNCTMWSPENFAAGIGGFDTLDRVYHTVNPLERTLVIVTTRRMSVDWAQIDEIHNWDWQLYVLHWDRDKQLLFIHNSSNAGFFKKLAHALTGDDAFQLTGPTVFRCLAGVNRLKLQNVGLVEQLGRLIRYTMRAGSDVEPGLSEAQKQTARKANVFGQGYENGKRSTIGCSYRGRIWSYRTSNLLELTRWCRVVGEKLLNDALDPEEVLRGTLVPTLVSERPDTMPISVEWPDVFFRNPEQAFEFEVDGAAVYRHEADLTLIEASKEGPLKFALMAGEAVAHFELSLFRTHGNPDYAVIAPDGQSALIRHRGRSTFLRDFFEEHPPTFWFSNGASLSGSEFVALRKQPEPYPKDKLDTWDWSGTNIRIEAQGPARIEESVQHRVVAELKKRGMSVIFDDDGHGESADVVGIVEEADHVSVEFWHCKASGEATPGARLEDLYELSGQAQKSVRWMEKTRDLFTHLMRREPRRHKGTAYTRYERGAEQDLLRVREKCDTQPVRLRVVIVQPGLSKAKASSELLELLSVTQNYLLETFQVPFGVVVSP